MFDYQRVMGLSRTVVPAWAPADAYAEAVMLQIGGKVMNVLGRSKPFYYPKGDGASFVRALLTEQLPCFQDPLVQMAAMRDLLFQPAILLPISNDESPTFAAVGVYEPPDSDDVVALRIDVASRHPVSAVASFAVDDDIEEFLELLYLDTEQHARSVPPGPKKAPKLAWLGGSASEGDTPADWVEQVEAVMAVRGLATTAFQQPYRNFKSVRHAVGNLQATVIVVWEPYAGDASGWDDLTTDGESRSGRASGPFRRLWLT